MSNLPPPGQWIFPPGQWVFPPQSPIWLPSTPLPTPGNLPAFQFLVAFQNNATDDPGQITTVASPAGTLGGVNVWTDISNQVRSGTWTRGRQHELGRFETGGGTLNCINFDGRFNPWNTSSPYYGFLTVNRPFRIQATPVGSSITYPVFTGHVKSWPILWPGQFTQMAQLNFADAFALFSLLDLASTKYKAQVIADGATCYFQLNEPALPDTGTGILGVTLADASGHGYVAVIVYGQQAVVFGSTSGPILTSSDTAADTGSYNAAGGQGFIQPQAAAGFSGNQSWSFETWMQSTSGGWLAGQNGGGTTNLWRIATSSLITANLFNNAGTEFDIPSYAYVSDGRWHHVVLTYNGSTNVASLYVDSGLAGTVTVTGGLNLSKSSLLGLGSRGELPLPQPSALGGLKIGQAAYYAGVLLSQAQVTNHFGLGVGFSRASSDQHIAAALNTIGWPAAARNLDVGNSICQQNTQNLAKTTALSYMQVVEETEDGALFMDQSGKVRYVARQSLITGSYTVSQQTFGDGGSPELPFEPQPDLALDDLDLWNITTAQRVGGMVQTATDTASTAQYGQHSTSLSGLLHDNEIDTLAHAQWITTHFAQPLIRLRKLVIRPVDDPALPAAVLSRELMDRVTVNRHILPGSSAFSQQSLIEKITHTFDAQGTWQVEFGLSPTDAIGGWWVLGDPVAGVLDTTTKAGW